MTNPSDCPGTCWFHEIQGWFSHVTNDSCDTNGTSRDWLITYCCNASPAFEIRVIFLSVIYWECFHRFIRMSNDRVCFCEMVKKVDLQLASHSSSNQCNAAAWRLPLQYNARQHLSRTKPSSSSLSTRLWSRHKSERCINNITHHVWATYKCPRLEDCKIQKVSHGTPYYFCANIIRVGIFHVDPRFYTAPVVWHFGLAQEF